MSDFRRTEILSGAFIVGALLLFTFFIFQADESTFERILGAGPERQFRALVPTVHGLREGSQVRWNGLQIGEVTGLKVSLPGSAERLAWKLPHMDPTFESGLWTRPEVAGIAVAFRLRAKLLGDQRGADQKIAFDPERTTVHVRQDGLLGDWYLDLMHVPPRGDEGEEQTLFEGDTILLWGRADGLFDQLTDLVRAAKPPLIALESALHKVDQQILSEANLRRVDGALSEANRMVTSLAASAEHLEALLKPDGPRSLEATILNDLRVLAQDIRTRVASINEGARRALESAEGLLRDGRQSLARIERDLAIADRSRELGALLNERIPEDLAALRGKIDRTLGRTEEFLATYQGLGNELRPELLGLLTGLRRAAWQLEVAFAKVRASPNVLLFGDDEQLAEPTPAEASGTLRQGRVGGFGQRSEKR